MRGVRLKRKTTNRMDGQSDVSVRCKRDVCRARKNGFASYRLIESGCEYMNAYIASPPLKEVLLHLV